MYKSGMRWPEQLFVSIYDPDLYFCMSLEQSMSCLWTSMWSTWTNLDKQTDKLRRYCTGLGIKQVNMCNSVTWVTVNQ